MQMSSYSSTNNSYVQGRLQTTILSAYDLRLREPPLYVSMTVQGLPNLSKTGPPIQRHKDRNSFKFSHSETLEISAPLPALYQATAIIELVYQDPSKTLTATYPLHQLKIHETTWLILHLESVQEKRNRQQSNSDSQNSVHNDDDLSVRPTLRLQMNLSGPYRTEIAAAIRLAQSWFRLMDGAEASSKNALSKLPSLSVKSIPLVGGTLAKVDAKFVLIPILVPVVAVSVVSAPVVAGILTISLPLVFPVVAAFVVIFTALLGAGMTVYCSTAHGRAQVGHLLGPFAHTLLSTKSGQRMVYQTGPRPNPVQLTRTIMPKTIWKKLMVSLLIDLIGSMSYLVPLAGEVTDIGWAPMQTILVRSIFIRVNSFYLPAPVLTNRCWCYVFFVFLQLMAMYDHVSPNLKYISFVEEILPLTDIVPSASMGWLTEFGVPLVLEKLFGNNNKASINDVQVVPETAGRD